MNSQMHNEALQAASVVSMQLAENTSAIAAIASRIKSVGPQMVMTVARGSSDHAATFAKYLFETQMGWVTASAAPSVVTLYEAQLKLKNTLVLAISQSGQSPDLTKILADAREQGAITLALVNEVDSPLARTAEFVLPLHAGKEKSVAATKSYIAALAALVHLVASLKQDEKLLAALQALPQRLAQATQMDWSPGLQAFKKVNNTYVVGRGFGFPIAQEAALKFKETAKIHAEAFSGAEILHGPFALVEKDFPVLMFAQADVSSPGLLDLAHQMAELGAKILLALSPSQAENLPNQITLLPIPETLHPICDPIVMIQSFYLMMAALSAARGLDPDKPANLFKVTKTW